MLPSHSHRKRPAVNPPFPTDGPTKKGNYTLAVTATGDSGAVLGNHIVRVAAIGEERTDPNADVSDPKSVDPIPPHSLTFEVKSGQNKADFDLKSR